MRRVVLVLATMALAILLAGGVARAIINGEPDRGPDAHPYVGAYVTKLDGKLLPAVLGHPYLSQSLPYSRPLHGTPDKGGPAILRLI